VAHADVNAAFNIATRPLRKAEQEDVLKRLADNFQRAKKQKMRRMMRSELPVLWIESYPKLTPPQYYEYVLPDEFHIFLFLQIPGKRVVAFLVNEEMLFSDDH
jgi:hypothetical protein